MGSAAHVGSRYILKLHASYLIYRANGEAFTSNTEVIAENGVLRFTQVTGAEAGAYICTATNDAGTTTATASLLIEGKTCQ